MNELTTTTEGGAITAPTPSMPTWMQPQNLDQALALADRVAASGLMPEHLKGNPGGVLMIIDQAQRWGMSPLAVAQATSIVHGKLCYEGKLVHAALVSMGAIKGSLRYQYDGKERTDGRSVTVTGVLPDGSVESITGSVADWKTSGNGSPWKPGAYDKMLAYRGAREWARMYAPAAMLGVYTPDEAIEISDYSVREDLPPPKSRGSDAAESGSTREPSEDDVRQCVELAVARLGGNDAAAIVVRPVLDQFGVAKSTEIKEALRQEFIDAINAAVDEALQA